ncbi:MAG: hypothetical protein KAS86_03980, partial [Candidatus Omnitrophica bacterium]|nr:hypothetical protein [Candidatus Omnitrophota bacterium]
RRKSEKPAREYAEEEAEMYYRAALELDPSNTQAVKGFLSLYGKDRADALFSGKNLELVTAVINETDDMEILGDLVKTAFQGRNGYLDTARVSVIKAIFERISSREDKTDVDVIRVMNGILPELRQLKPQGQDLQYQVQSIVNITDEIQRDLKSNATFRLNPGIDMTFGLFSAYVYTICNNRGEALKSLRSISPRSERDKPEFVFAGLRLHLVNGDVKAAEYSLRALARLDPGMTPLARSLVAEAYFNFAGSEQDQERKKLYLERAAELWPGYLEAREALRDLYRQSKDISIKNKAKQEDISIQGIKAAKKAGRGLSPGVMEWSRALEIREHIIKAPVIERIIYFGLPLVAGLLIHGAAESAGMPGLMTFNSIFALAQLPFIYRFIKKHKGERRMAWAVSAGSLVLPLVYDLAPVYYLAVAIGLHATVNLSVFVLNAVWQKRLFNYATRADNLPEVLPRKRVPPLRTAGRPLNTAVIGIVGAESLAERFTERYPDMEFISEENKNALLERMEEIPGMQPRVLVEMTDVRKIDGAVEDAVRMAEVQAFTALYPYIVHPYMVGLREETLRELRKVESRGKMLEILRDTIPVEIRQDVFESLICAYHSGTALEGKPVTRMPVPGMKEEEDLVEGYIDSFDSYMEAGEGTDAERGLLDFCVSLNDYLVRYLKDNPGGNLADIFLRHRHIAAEQEIRRMENAIIDLIPGRSVIPRAVVIDSRLPGVDLDAMAPAIERYADKKFYVCVITATGGSVPDAVKNIRNVIHITFDPEARETMEETVMIVRKRVADREGTKDINDIPVAGISMVTLDSMAGDMIGYLQRQDRKKAAVPNFAILGQKILTRDAEGRRMNRLMPTIATLNILWRFKDMNNVPHLIAVECPKNTIEEIEAGLKHVLYSLERLTKLKIFEKLREFIETLRSIRAAV